MTTDDTLRYPIGRFVALTASPVVRRVAADDLAALPGRMRAAVMGLDTDQLDVTYRPGGWTIRQVVHHVADSHMHAYIRTKQTLTEATPTIKPYDEGAWALFPDVVQPIDASLNILDGLHARLVHLYRGLSETELARTFIHPERPEPQSLDRQLQMYAWHSKHHVAHITGLRQREGW